MKFIFSFLLTLVTGSLYAQGNGEVAVLIKPVKEKPADWTTESLAYHLTASLKTEKEKVYAIFRWITDNIDYRVAPVLSVSRSFRRKQQDIEDDDTSMFLKPLDNRVADLVLQKREAVCDGYARLFKVLCDHAGLQAEVVNGYARVNGGRVGRNFRANHSWNAVRIDSAWHLLDVTWASGYTNMRGDMFIRHYDDTYFLTPPSFFIRDHYPEDPAWTLLPEPPLIREFYQMPFKHTAFIRHNIRSFSPLSGVIEAKLGDKVEIEIETFDDQKKLEVWDRPFGDPRRHTSPVWLNYPEKPSIVRGDKVKYAYTVHSPHVQWLYVVYNGECVLQYRLNVHQTESDSLLLAK